MSIYIGLAHCRRKTSNAQVCSLRFAVHWTLSVVFVRYRQTEGREWDTYLDVNGNGNKTRNEWVNNRAENFLMGMGGNGSMKKFTLLKLYRSCVSAVLHTEAQFADTQHLPLITSETGWKSRFFHTSHTWDEMRRDSMPPLKIGQHVKLSYA